MPDSRTLYRTEHRVTAFVRDRGVLGNGEHCLLLLSGGADSMGLLALVRVVDRRLGLGLRLAALHVDYGLRGADSSRDRAIVVQACELEGIPLHQVLLEGRLRGSDFQQRARDLRFRHARSFAAQHGCHAIVTGHTADDQAETVLYRLAKYGAPSALEGMAEREGDIARPLLCLRAREVRDYCAAAGIDYGEDVSNASEVYARNVVRLSALPALERVSPRAVEALVEASALARDERGLLSAMVDAAWARAAVTDPDSEGGVALDVHVLAAQPPAVRRLLVRRLAAAVLGEHALIGKRVTAALDRLAAETAGSRQVSLRSGWVAVREYDRIRVRARREPHSCAAVQVPLATPVATGAGNLSRARFCDRDYEVVQVRGASGPAATGVWLGLPRPVPAITLRHPRRGDRFKPLGGTGSQTVLDFLKEQKIPREARTRTLVVEAEGEVVWVEVPERPGSAPSASQPLSGRVARTRRVSQSTAFTVQLRRV